MVAIVNRASAEHYKWGGANATDCDGWHLVRTPHLSIIEEIMPPGTQEVRHLHARARQFFYVLEGLLTIEIENEEFHLCVDQGIEISPGQTHQAKNTGSIQVRMIVTSQPPSHGDRIPA